MNNLEAIRVIKKHIDDIDAITNLNTVDYSTLVGLFQAKSEALKALAIATRGY